MIVGPASQLRNGIYSCQKVNVMDIIIYAYLDTYKPTATQTPKLLASLFSMAIIIIYIEDYKHDTEFRMCSAHDYCSNGCLSWNIIVPSPTWLSLNGFLYRNDSTL